MPKKRISVEQAKKLSQKEKEQLLSRIEKMASYNERTYWGCPQAVLSSLLYYFDIGDGSAFKAATCFTGGVTHKREVCGALSGGVMAIGLAYGRGKYAKGLTAHEQPEYVEAKLRVNKFCEKFEKMFGSLRCESVFITVRGKSYKAYPKYNTLEAFLDHDNCGRVTGPAARLAAEVMLEPVELYQEGIDEELGNLKQVREEQRRKPR